MAEILVVAGSLAQKPRQGGHTWVFLQYLLGFRRLGWDVLFLDWLSPDMCIDAQGQPCPPENSINVKAFRDLMNAYRFEDASALLDDCGATLTGLPRQQVLEKVKNSAVLFNVMGYLADPEILGAAPQRVFLDIDPGFGQMWRALDLHDPFAGHDAFVTVGAGIGRPDCSIPTAGLPWITSRPPVVLAAWPAQSPAPQAPITTVASWRGAYGLVTFREQTYGLRVHEFRKFIGLPRTTRQRLQLALAIDPAETNDLAALESNGWELCDPKQVAGDPWTYLSYIQSSKAEFSVAKNMYVQSQSGWFSDRSVCYLASGRPVIAQDTGVADLYPADAGLMLYRTFGEAQESLERVERDYGRQARAARAVAEEFFDSDKVLDRLLARLGIASTHRTGARTGT